MELLKRLFGGDSKSTSLESTPQRVRLLFTSGHPTDETLEGFEKLDSIDDLIEGDEVIVAVGTWCCKYPNDDWRWLQGYVKAIKPVKKRPAGNYPHDLRSFVEAVRHSKWVNYNIIELSPVKTEEERKKYPEAHIIDVNQPFHNPNSSPDSNITTYGTLYRRVA